jgi:hypothetical protein
MRRFWSFVASYARTIRAFFVVAVIYVSGQLFSDQLVTFVKWAAKTAGMTPTAVLLFAVTNPLVTFFGAIGITLVGIFLLAWRDIRRQPVAPPSVAHPLPVITPQLSSPPIALAPVPPTSNVKLLEIRSMRLSFSVGSFVHDVGEYAPENAAGILLTFVNPADEKIATAPAQDVVASLTFRASGHDVNVVNGWWHGGAVFRTDIPINQARELLVVAAHKEGQHYQHLKEIVYAIDARRLALKEQGPRPIYTPLVKDKYHVNVTLRAGSVTLATHEFTLTTKPFALVRDE